MYPKSANNPDTAEYHLFSLISSLLTGTCHCWHCLALQEYWTFWLDPGKRFKFKIWRRIFIEGTLFSIFIKSTILKFSYRKLGVVWELNKDLKQKQRKQGWSGSVLVNSEVAVLLWNTTIMNQSRFSRNTFMDAYI